MYSMSDSFPNTTGEFIIDIAPPQPQRETVPMVTTVPIIHLPILPAHANPLLLDGFSLDVAAGGDATVPQSRKRKTLSPSTTVVSSSASSPSTLSLTNMSDSTELIDDAAGVEVQPKKKRKSTSLRVRVDSSDSPVSAGTSSPLLALLQESNSSSPVSGTPSFNTPESVAVKLSKKERQEMKRHKAKMKLLRLEASIEALKMQLHQTAQMEAEASARASVMAAAATEAARIASLQHAQQAQSHMVDSFFAASDVSEPVAASLPPLSPLDLGCCASEPLPPASDASSPQLGRSLLEYTSRSSSGGAGSAHTTPVVSAVSTPNESSVSSIDESVLDAELQQLKSSLVGVEFAHIAHVQQLEHGLLLKKMHANVSWGEAQAAALAAIASPSHAAQFLHGLVASGNAQPADVANQLSALNAFECESSVSDDIDSGFDELAQLLIKHTRAQRSALQQQYEL